MIRSRLRTKARTTIPIAVRIALDLEVGDDLAYRIEKNRVILTKASPVISNDPFASFDEWDTDEDRQAYATL